MKRWLLILIALALPGGFAGAANQIQIVGAKCRVATVTRDLHDRETMGILCHVNGKDEGMEVYADNFRADIVVARVFYEGRTNYFNVVLVAPSEKVSNLIDMADRPEFKDEIKKMGLDPKLVKTAELDEFYLKAQGHPFIGKGEKFVLTYPNVAPAAEAAQSIKSQILAENRRNLWVLNSYQTFASEDGKVSAELAEDFESINLTANGAMTTLRLLNSEWPEQDRVMLSYGDASDFSSSQNRIQIEGSYYEVKASYTAEGGKSVSLNPVAFRHAFLFDVVKVVERKNSWDDPIPAPIQVKGLVNGKMVSGYLAGDSGDTARWNRPLQLQYQVYGVDGRPIDVIKAKYFMNYVWLESFLTSMGLYKQVYWNIEKPGYDAKIHKHGIVREQVYNQGTHEPIYQKNTGLIGGDDQSTPYAIGGDGFIGKGAVTLKRVLVPYGADLFEEPGEAGNPPKIAMILQ